MSISQLHAQAFGIGIPSQFLSALPYAATIIVLILISHNLPDIFAAADRIIVLARGVVAGERRPAETNDEEIVRMMMGATL